MVLKLVLLYQDVFLFRRQIEQILKDESEPHPFEDKLAVLTAGERTHWASARRHFFNKGPNKASLDCIEKAAFVVALDDFPYEYDTVSLHINFYITIIALLGHSDAHLYVYCFKVSAVK